MYTSGIDFQLANKINSTQTTGIRISPKQVNELVFEFTADSGVVQIIETVPGGLKVEWMSFTGITDIGDGVIELTGVVRDLPSDTNSTTGSGSGQAFSRGATIRLIVDHRLLNAVARTDAANPFDEKQTFSGGFQPPVFANNTARDAAFPTPWNGLYVISGAEAQIYYNSTWNVLGTATVSSATESVEGTTELATLAEHDPATTGPKVVQAKNTRKTSTGAAEGQVVALNSNAEVDLTLLPAIPASKFDFTGTPSSTTFARGDGTWATPANGVATAILQTTRNTTSASGTTTVAHGLSGTPKLVMVEMYARALTSSSDIGYMSSSGSSDGTTNKCIVSYESNNAGTTFDVTSDASYCVAYIEDSSVPSSPVDAQRATISMDATNITFNWTKTGTPTSATMYIQLTVFKF